MKKSTLKQLLGASGLVALFYLLVLTTSQAQTNCFTFADFASTNNLNLVGNAAKLTNIIRLTSAGPEQSGAMWYVKKQACASGFISTFRFRISEPGTSYGGPLGADGIGFSVQNIGNTAPGSEYGVFTNSVAVTFNTFYNSPAGEPSDNFVGIVTNNNSANNASYSFTRDLNPTPIRLKDGNEHTATVQFDGAGLSVSIDGIVIFTNIITPISIGVDSEGNGWVGLSARTGGSYENHDILGWSFCSGQGPRITSQPQSQTVNAGANIQFTVGAAGAPPLSYQWRFNTTNIAGATTSSLSLSNVQSSNSGNYSVTVSNSFGSIVSSNAMLLVQPVVTGSNCFAYPNFGSNTGLSLVGSATQITNFIRLTPATTEQSGAVWYSNKQFCATGFNTTFRFKITNPGTSFGGPLGADGIAFSVQNVGNGAAGTEYGAYSNCVGVTFNTFNDPGAGEPSDNFVGIVTNNNSANNASYSYTKDLNPTPIRLKDGNEHTATVQYDGIGLSVSIDGISIFTNIVTSISRALDTNGNGWVGLSARTGGSYENHDVLGWSFCGGQPLPSCASSPPGLVGWWRGENNTFDQADSNHGSLTGNATYGLGRVGSAFVFDGSGDAVSLANRTNLQLQNFTIEAWAMRGDANRVSFDFNGSTIFGYGSGGYLFGLTDDGRLRLGRTDISEVLSSPSITDTTFHHVGVTKNGTAVVFYLDGAAYPAPAYSDSFTFSAPPAIGARGDNFQNSFIGRIDEVSIYNRALSGTEIQSIYNAGGAGKCTTPTAPFIVTQPANQTVTAGGSASFSVVAGGSPPLTYQWRFGGTNIAGATGSSFTIATVQMSNGGTYSVVVSNSLGSVLSSNATLTVNPGPTTLRVANASAASGASVTVPVLLTANGRENALSFSLSWNSARLTYVSTILANGSGPMLFVNESQSSTGRLGVAMALPTGQTFPVGAQEVVEVTFTTAIVTNPAEVLISFVDQPIVRQVSDTSGNTLQANYVPGTVNIAAVSYEGDVSPRPNGDKAVTVTDWVIIGRFAAHLDTPANGSEFQRADCAPRATQGNGQISITDWVQAGRYAAGLDPLTPVGGPTGPVPGATVQGGSSGPTPLIARTLQAVGGTIDQGQNGPLSVSLRAVGDENALGFSLLFDAAKLTYTGATLGSGASGASLNVNTEGIASGQLGFALALSSGHSFASGLNELVRVTFQANAAGNAAIALADEPIIREVSDAGANTLSADYVNGTIVINPVPSLKISQSDQSITLAWPSWATNFILQQADPTGDSLTWTPLSITPSIINDENVVVIPMDGASRFYRLQKQ